MPTVIPVKFAFATRDLWFDPGETGAQEGDHVICSTERGTEIGLATMDAIEMDDEKLKATIGNATLKPVLRIASDYDLDRAEELAEQGERDFPTYRRIVMESGLDMKPVGVEYLFDGSKAVCYFSADERVDFRQLVRDLARELRIRIDMRQIGVREEAAIIGGYAHCGQELCCARFGRQFEPVSIRMAKEQDLPLNSTKISGACGRLMCCLRYEFEAYRDFKGRAPKRNAVIETPLGKGKIIEYDTPKEEICLRLENGKTVRVALADMETSEAAVKKSQELNCPCRPDTVPRAALDKLESPEIKMALAELDRKMGMVPEETFDESDLFVESKPRRRRRRSSVEDEAPEAQKQETQARTRKARGAATRPDVQEGATESAGQSKRRRRRRNKAAAAAAAASGANEGAGTAQAAAQARDAKKGAEQRQQTTTRRRRRHHATTGADEAATTLQGKSNQKQQEKSQGQAPKSSGQERPRRRRRPGDKGGLAVHAAQETRDEQAQPKRQNQGLAPSAGEGANAADQKPRRRRRRRGGRGRGGKGASGTAGETPKTE